MATDLAAFGSFFRVGSMVLTYLRSDEFWLEQVYPTVLAFGVIRFLQNLLCSRTSLSRFIVGVMTKPLRAIKACGSRDNCTTRKDKIYEDEMGKKKADASDFWWKPKVELREGSVVEVRMTPGDGDGHHIPMRRFTQNCPINPRRLYTCDEKLTNYYL
jgi:hypothetical protein